MFPKRTVEEAVIVVGCMVAFAAVVIIAICQG